jgi:hypothetical protein
MLSLLISSTPQAVLSRRKVLRSDEILEAFYVPPGEGKR